MKGFSAAIFFVLPLFPCLANALPPLYGDGVHDDTAAIQARIDSTRGQTCLPRPKKCYLISRTLVFGDDSGLELDADTRILLAPGSSCPLARNSNTNGNRSITITGGVWDMDNLRQAPNPGWRHLANPPLPRLKPPAKYEADLYRGNAFYFESVSNLVFRGATIRNPVTYAFQMCRVSFFKVEDIRFDFTTFNPIKGNMDGIHLDGGCRHGRIARLRGCTWDDMVALNANDSFCAAHEEPITDIEIDDIEADYAHSAVRLLSAPMPVERVKISNVRGGFYVYGIGFTHYFPERHELGLFKDIEIRNVSLVSQPPPGGKKTTTFRSPVFFDNDVRLENVKFDGVRLSPGARVSEEFGYDPVDSTRFLQAALDSGHHRIIIDKKAGPWYTKPLVCRRSDVQIILERGVELTALRGGFKGKWDSLLTLFCATNVSVVGSARLKMWKEDYMSPAYAHSEHRHALSMRACENVFVQGLTLANSGGDGVYLAASGKNTHDPCRNITLVDVTSDGNLRQGASIISAENVLFDRCRLLNTKGGAPEAGIDLEPNANHEPIRNIELRDCVIEGNAGYGIDCMYMSMGRDAGELSVLVRNCTLSGNKLGAYRYQPPRGGTFRSPNGTTTFINVKTKESDGTERTENFMKILGVEADAPRAPFAFDGKFKRVVDTCPGRAVSLSGVAVRAAGSGKVTFYASSAGDAEIFARQYPLPKREPHKGELRLVDLAGNEISKFAYPGQKETRLPVTVPAAGFYSIVGGTGRSRLVYTRSSVPIAADLRPLENWASPWRFSGMPGDVWFPVGEEGLSVGIAGGEGRENVHVTIYDPEGKIAFDQDNIWEQVFWKPENHKKGLWRARFSRPSNGVLDDFMFDLGDRPDFLFLSKEKYWE